MPLDSKKVLWTVVSISIVLVVALGIALALFFPPSGAAEAPASVAGAAPPRTTSPDAYLREPTPAPIPSAGAQSPTGTAGDNIIIIYGDKPAADLLGQQPTPSGSSNVNTAPAAAPATAPATPPRVAAPPPAATTPQTAARPAASKTVTVTEFWIQAGSFSSKSRAEDLQRSLAGKGLSSIITLSEVDGKSWYRVRIGPYDAKKDAEAWMQKVRAIPGCEEAYVSQQTARRSS